MKVIQCQNQKQKPKSCDAFVGRREMSSPAEAPTWGRALEQSCPVLRMRRGSQEVGAIWPLGCTFAHRAQKSRNLTFTPPTGGPQIHGRRQVSQLGPYLVPESEKFSVPYHFRLFMTNIIQS